VVKDLRLKDLYQGVISLESGQLDQEVARYLIISEQVGSLVEIGVRLDDQGELTTAGGVLVQLLPGQRPGALEGVAHRLEDLPVLDVLLADGYGPEDILAMIFGAIEYQELERRALSFRCSCSRERCRRALLILGQQEIQALAAEGEATIDCHFCHERYVFDQAALLTLLAESLMPERTPLRPENG
jgi:molecular chaperone Hsp33